jgi:hypothetical protein
MLVSTLFTQVNTAYRGSDDDAPTSGTDFNLWLATANRKQNEWATDSVNNWQSLWSTDTLAPVIAAGTQTYNLPATFVAPSDRVTVTNGTNITYFTVIKPEEAPNTSGCVYISGSNPQKLTFVDTIATGNALVGGTITVPGYHTLADFTLGTDTVLVDNPYWLVYAVAAELAFNDITYSDKSPDLNAKANNLYQQMARNNRRGTNNNPRVTRTNVSRILGPQSESGVGTL